MHFIHLLHFLSTFSRNGLVVHIVSFFFYFHVHKVDLLDFKVAVAKPVVQILYHFLLDLAELVDRRVQVSEEKRDLVLTLV
jgi:hypothetical protein